LLAPSARPRRAATSLSYGNNRNTGNLANGAPTGTLANQ
jgi:hypothetical protein